MSTGHGSTQIHVFPASDPYAREVLDGHAVVTLSSHPVYASVHVATRAEACAIASAFLDAMRFLPAAGDEVDLVPVCEVCGGPAHLPLLDAPAENTPGHDDPARDADHEVEVGYRTAAEVTG